MDQPLSRRELPVKRKRIVLTLEEKLEVIQFRDSGHSIDKIAERYGIGASTVSEIYKKRVEIENAVEKNKIIGVKFGRKTLKEGKKPLLEDELFNWFLEQKEKGEQPSQNDLKQKAVEINQSSNNDELWNPTKGWLSGFKERYGIKVEPQQVHTIKEEVPVERNTNSYLQALESAEFLLEFMDTRNFPLKDVITIRMVRDKIANDANENPEYLLQ